MKERHYAPLDEVLGDTDVTLVSSFEDPNAVAFPVETWVSSAGKPEALIVEEMGLRQVPDTGDIDSAIDGELAANPDKVADITDVWTFARDTSSRDPNWKLVGTGSAA